ncbi:Fc.00g082730.m01.CDS01 [Cosmosporella sp. VM-42]
MFKVVIVGGGPTGLTAAHALGKAGIDFLVLERRDNLELDTGASLVLEPQSLRIMRQLGLLDSLMDIGAELCTTKGFLVDGYEFKRTTELETLKDNHGIAPVAFHRAHLIQALYNGLSDDDKARYLTGKRVVDIKSTEDDVTVKCGDGSTYEGSIVLGADGVHSATRGIMRDLALTHRPGIDWDPKDPFITEYRCMWCSFPRPSEPGANFETTNKDLSVMYLTGRDRGWILLYDRFPESTNKRHAYTDKDIEDFAAKFANYPVNENLKVKDVSSMRLTWGMSDLQEGIAKHWSWGRIVLAGDACHKFTPNAGLGLNNGIQDIVALCNALYKAVNSSTTGQPGQATLTRIFEDYREKRSKPLRKDYEQSALITRLQAWANGFYYFISRFILSRNFIVNIIATHMSSPQIKAGLVLDYVRAIDLPKGKISWEHAVPSLPKAREGYMDCEEI